MSKQNLTSLISQLQSDKVKPRQEALGLLDDAFVQNDKLVSMLAGNPDEWLAVFRALFAAVTLEKVACLKKGFDHAPPASIGRLETAGVTVRHVTERSVSQMNGKVTRTLLTHLLETMTHKGSLVTPISMNYAQAILAVCSYTPHLEHLDSERWISLVSLAFAVILGDSLRGSRGFAEDEVDDDSDHEMDVQQSSDADDEPSGSGKRRRGESARRSVQPTPPPSGHASGRPRTVSSEQTVFMMLLTVLFNSPWAPYMSPGVSTKILHRLCRFFVTFPAWSSAHYPALAAVNVVLSQVELNDTRAVTDFGLKIWNSLLSHWNKKEKHLKQEVVVAMTTLFPFITKPDVAENSKHNVRERVVELYTCLEDELSRLNLEDLSFDSMRFQLRDMNAERGVFEADTFRSGFKFTTSQALTWAIMELHADCARTLHLYSERFGSPVKRRKLETPLSTILMRAKNVSISSSIRIRQLQALLFIIDRHWAVLYDALQQEIVNTLLDLVVHEDSALQSWTFLCLAAIAAAKGTVADDTIDWDSIWSHSVRRTNVLNVCRAACHTAHVLLAIQRLPAHSVLGDIESFSKDLVVQGPTFPYDSVCSFLCDCLRISSQDMRLHRIQLPDKVLSWLSENWNMAGPDLRSKMPPHAIVDVLALLEATCGLSQANQIYSRHLLPECPIVETAIERQRTAAIRDYLLHTRITPFRPQATISSPSGTIGSARSDNTSQTIPLAAPSPREIKVSAFLLKSLDLLCGEWQNTKDPTSEATPEKVRRSIDGAVIALCFEASLVCNKTQSNRRVVQAACKLVAFARPCLELTRWEPSERALILMGLEPLTSDGSPRREDDPWLVMPGPVKGSGVKRSTLVKLSGEIDTNMPNTLSRRRELQNALWQSADVQDTFENVMSALRKTLRVVGVPFQTSAQASEEDRGHGFVTDASDTPWSHMHELKRVNQLCAQVCMTFLTVAPMLQSGKFHATRDKGLTDYLTGSACEPRSFLTLAPEFFRSVRSKHMHVSASTVQKFINRFEDLLNMYAFGRSATATMLAIQFLHSTSHVWMQPAAAESKRGVRLLYAWLSSRVLQGNLGSWTLRDRFICFLDHYTTIDPRESFLAEEAHGTEDEENDMELDEGSLPSRLLPKMADDEDTRVRFRVAVANGRLLGTTDVTKVDPMRIYERIKNELSLDMNNWERMLTRFLHLGNAMVASSAVRRGPYWHLLEICLHHPGYTAAVEAVISAVADRLGLPNLRNLFEAYASQLVRSVVHAEQKFFGFPPSLLGYADRRQCARATFSLLAPMILTTGGDRNEPDLADNAVRMFEDHCNQAQKSVSEGLLECFADVVGTRIVHCIDLFHDDTKQELALEASRYLAHQIQQLAAEASNASEPATLIRQNLDRVVFAILRTCSDEDYSRGGTIARALKADGRSDRAVATFHALTIYRKPEDFKMHRPNLPAFSSLSVLRSIDWLSKHVDEVYTAPIIYHVTHHLLAAIGRSVLLNEQMRLLHSLSIWISINASSFRDLTLLRTLMRGAIILLSQSDLAHFAQGIVSWAFGHYRSLGELEPTFPDLMGHIARIAHDYSQDTPDSVLIALGNEIMEWVEKQAWTLSRDDLIRPQILSALPLWPRKPSEQLEQLSGELSQSQSLSDVLHNPRVISGKFRLVRRLRDLVDVAVYPHDQFCEKDFWHLKSCIPSHDQMQDEDVDAFVDILFKNAAQVMPLSDELVPTRSVATLHKDMSRTTRREFRVVSLQRVIVISLFDILSTGEASQIHRAYTTLRLLFALPIPGLVSPKDWLPEYQAEISYLSSCPLNPISTPARSLTELQASEALASEDFLQWVCKISTLLNDVLASTDIFYAQLSPSLGSDSFFAANMLPVLVHGILLNNKDARKSLSEYFSSILEKGSPQCRHSVVDVVLHLRNFVPPGVEDPLAYDKWLDINFRLLSRGAMSCGAYTTALLFLELASEYHGSSAANDSTTEEILYDIYSHIEEPDGFYAIKSKDVRGFLTRRFHHEGQWDKAFQFHGADFAAEAHGFGGPEGVYQSLHANGFDNLAMAVLQSSNSQATEAAANSSDLGYQLAWRTEMWDLPEPRGDGRAASALYSALRAIHKDRDLHAVDILLRDALRQEMSLLRDTGNEDMVGVRARLQTLLSLGEIRKWRGASVQETLAAKEISPGTLADFVDVSSEFDFATLESIIATRMSLLRSTKLREQREQIGNLESGFVTCLKDVERKCLVRLSEAARVSEHHQIALNATVRAQRLESVQTFEVSEEFANVLWLQKEHKLAVEYLKSLVAGTEHIFTVDQGVPKRALILSRLGTWSAEACLQKPTDIQEQFFDPATRLLFGSESPDIMMDGTIEPALAIVFHQYAHFAEDQYHTMLRSPEVSRLQVYVERKRQEIQQLKESLQGMEQKDPRFDNLFRDKKKAQKLCDEDAAQMSVHTESRTTFLIQAIEMYSRCLQASDDFDDSAVIRLCSLWFANFNDIQMQWNFNRALEKVPSRKFVFLAHQLSARLSNTDANTLPLPDNQKYLQALVIRMCNEHPFHSLYQVWALLQGAPNGRRRSSRPSSAPSHTGRASAASHILTICRQTPYNTERVQGIERLCQVSLEWAQYPLKPKKVPGQKEKPPPRTRQKLPPTIQLRKISNIPIPVATAHTPLDPTLQYNNIVTIVNYSDSYRLAGGNNLPKISECVGSDGQLYTQLFKGEGGDDLRQDAVMEQVFELVNVILKRDRHTRRRQLGVRCYKVIPLAPQAGLLEFVQNTMPLGDWLHPAHIRHARPGDTTKDAIVKVLSGYRDEWGALKDDAENLHQTFVATLKRFPPVFRHFFTERYKLPMAWFSTRLNYARSAATTSIVGHILGLGDRHVSNILIDNTTGELVHIDLGIAFDQGKLLPVPELVPFRLTGDMIDGLGTAGTEGIFRRCAEETLRVLRAESGVITTVLEVFRHDPLHSWTASAIKIRRVQGASDGTNMTYDTTRLGIGIDMASDSADESADRALTSVHRKLDKSLSVEYTVNELIVSATDSMNISQIFVGWSPYL